MKKLTISVARYRDRNVTSAQCDEKTVLTVAEKCIREEYGRRGGIALQPISLKDGVLCVGVADALWAQELWVRRDAIMRAINAACRMEVVRRIRATVRDAS